ncbi:substrate-binding periplasmic protein [Fluviispira sanaruensis]|uniref:Solute-binding protein family 3/N-terminal domain-containing protein n=1 Tax=Fluviispira sanaruensis TaxID=2493639 RepID=A0A4P2VTH1_FLUSA|nr:transporter substrate-binding domain-containing protein [Fluviispira sanaruensis]BBH52172.1 hypothetical protein JCM31447_06120 [Fluviispira sanaruensis]
MKKIIFYSIFLIFHFNLFADVIKVTAVEYCPYICIPEKNKGLKGLNNDVLIEIYKKFGHKLTFEYMPWQRAVNELERGSYDLTPIIEANQYSKITLSNNVFIKYKISCFTRKNTPWSFNGLKSIGNLRLGVQNGFDYSSINPEFDKYIKNETEKKSGKVSIISGEDATEKIIKMILADRLDFICDNEGVIMHFIKNKKLQKNLKQAGVLNLDINYVGFSMKSKKAGEYKKIFDDNIIEFKKSEIYKNLLTKYGIEDPDIKDKN